MSDKKLLLAGVFLISLLILNIFVISLIKAQDSDDSPIPQEFRGVAEAGEKLIDEENRSQYLKQEWGKILANNKIMGPIIKAYAKVSPYTDPVFRYIIGMTPSLTWLFALTLTLWICLAIYIFRFLELFSIVSEITQYLIFIATMIVISFTKVCLNIAQITINRLSLLTTWWMQLIGIGIVLGILILASVFSKQLKEFFEKAKERRAKMKEEANRMELEKNAKVASILGKAVTHSTNYDEGFS
jgi:hypothetical protein